jgi:hypothetical protein
MTARQAIVCALAFIVGSLLALAARDLYRHVLDPWLRRLAQARARRPEHRKTLYWKAWRAAREVEDFGNATEDAQMTLLGFVLVNALVKVEPTREKLESIGTRMGALREAADAVGSQYEDKWWRGREHWTAVRANEIVRAAVQSVRLRGRVAGSQGPPDEE